MQRQWCDDCGPFPASGMETGTAETVKQGSVAKP
jgi:hypothetical protein